MPRHLQNQISLNKMRTINLFRGIFEFVETHCHASLFGGDTKFCACVL